MDIERWNQVQNIFNEVVDKPAALQHELLKTLCNGDEDLRAAVLRMLAADSSDSSMLDGDVRDAAHQLIDYGTDKIPAPFFGPYRLVRLLGEGGMGVVYLAERDDLGNRAAVKVLRDSALSPMRRQRFAVEQKTLAQLNHPSIARLFDADTLEDGTPYIVMEYVEGIPLTEFARQQGTSPDDILRLFRSVCDAVRYAHSQAVIHRDLKPSNILVTEGGVVKLLDFGIAKHLELQETETTQTVTVLRLMTPAYASPEQIRGEPVSIQSDVYSLGVILYELLARRLPFDLSKQTPGQVEQTILVADPKPPSSFVKALSDDPAWRLARLSWSELDTLCLTAIHKDPHRRYQSVEAFIRDIDHYLKGEPLEARPDSLSYRTSKFIARNKRNLILASSVSLVIVAFAIVFAVRLAHARRETAAEALRAERIKTFMLDLFDSRNKFAAPSGELSALTLVNRGVQEAETFDQDPETQAELYQTLAGIYQNLGNFDRADPLLQSALARRKRLFGAESPQVAETMTALGLLRLDQAKPAEAEQLTRAALAMDRRFLAPGDPAIGRSMSSLGQVLVERGSYDQATPLLQNAARMQSGKSEAARDLARTSSALADVNYYKGRYAVAEALNRQALAIDEKAYGTVHPRVADDYISLGEIQHDRGHDAEAEKLYRQGLGIMKSWYGEKHPGTAFAMMAVGQALVFQKRYDDAFPLLQRSLTIQEQVFGESHPKVAMAFNQLGVLEQRRGNFNAAEHDFLRMLEINRATYGDRNNLVAIAYLNLGQVYLQQKRYPLSERSFREALDLLVENLPAEHPNIAIAEVKLGAVLVKEHKYKEAEAPLLRGYQTLAKQVPPLTDRLTSARQDLMAVYQGLHQEEKAALYRSQGELPRAKEAIAHR